MSVVIVGGHDRMVGQYKDICKKYRCKAKVFTQSKKNLECLIGDPDLIIVFTNPVSHEMVKVAKKTAAAKEIALVQSHCGSGSSLHTILKDVRSAAPAS
ncbi:MAG: DUF2325 domain-containing protein [Coriobacteriales bacterium]|jgi:hypothetical protein|nr:DUF2325 domain-containing protein [Coriobacteriales bacterium]